MARFRDPEEQEIVYSDLDGPDLLLQPRAHQLGRDRLGCPVQHARRHHFFEIRKAELATFVIFNPEATEQTCEVRRNGKAHQELSGTPPRQTVTHILNPTQAKEPGVR